MESEQNTPETNNNLGIDQSTTDFNLQKPPQTRWTILLVIAVIIFGGYFAFAYISNSWPFELGSTNSEVAAECGASNPYCPDGFRCSPINYIKGECVPEIDLRDQKTYRNDEFGFEITFGNKWNGYKAVTARDVDGSAIIFCLPTNDKNYPDSLCDEKNIYSGFASVFNINIFTQDQWDQMPEIFQKQFIGQGGDLIFSYDKAQDSPDDLRQQYNEVDQILSTFRFVDTIDTSNWQTYRSEQMGFEIKYSPDWFIDKEGPHEVFFKTNDKGAHFILFEILSSNLKSIEYTLLAQGYERQILSVDNNQVIKLTQRSRYSEEVPYFYEISTFFVNKSLMGRAQGGENVADVFDQMLSTFRFINASNTFYEVSPEELANSCEKYPTSIPSAIAPFRSGSIVDDPELGKIVIDELLVSFNDDVLASRSYEIICTSGGIVAGGIPVLNFWQISLPGNKSVDKLKSMIKTLSSYPEIETVEVNSADISVD